MKSEIIGTIQDGVNNKVSFEVISGGVKYFSKDIKTGCPHSYLEISIFKFTPQHFVIKEGYEGGTWERNLKDEKTEFDRFEIGPHYEEEGKMIILGSWLVPFWVKKIGSKKFEIFDTYFKPSGELSRLYITFVDNTKIEISITFPLYEHPEINYDYENQKVKYPKEIMKMFLDLESIISEINF